jgi:hypothetical protein
VVAQVLVDALAGGGNPGDDVDSLLASLPHNGGHGGPVALEALASSLASGLHGPEAIAAAFAMAHPALAMDPLVFHADASAAHA